MDGMIFATWSFELHTNLRDLRARDDRNIPMKHSALINRTEVRGALTENRCGLLIAPHEDSVKGYYVIDVGSLLGVAPLDIKSADKIYGLYGEYMALLYIDSESSNPEIVGVFHPRTWKEKYPSNSTTPASFRLPAPLLEEYKEACNYYNDSQAAAVTHTMWNYIVGWRLDMLTNTIPSIVLLGNGEKWVPDPAIQYLHINEGGDC